MYIRCKAGRYNGLALAVVALMGFHVSVQLFVRHVLSGPRQCVLRVAEANEQAFAGDSGRHWCSASLAPCPSAMEAVKKGAAGSRRRRCMRRVHSVTELRVFM